MSFTTGEAFPTAILIAQALTDEQFAAFCSRHPDLFFEISASRMAPADSYFPTVRVVRRTSPGH